MKKIILLAILALILLPGSTQPKNEWTVIVYMVNDGKPGDAIEQANYRNLSRMKYCCDHCLEYKHRNGRIDYAHQVLVATQIGRAHV